jgi:hypothetical protein
VCKEVTEGEMSDALVVALCEKRGHGDDIFRIVVLDVLEPSEFALARFLVVDEIGGLDILSLMGSSTYKIDFSDSELTHLYIIA